MYSPANPQLSSFSPQLSCLLSAWADISKAKRLLDWSPQTAPADGFRRTVEWQVANREWINAVNP